MGTPDVGPRRDAMNLGRTFREMHRQVRGGTDAETIHIGQDELFDVLADGRRRLAIERLARDEGDPPTCSELAVEIAAAETHMETDQVPPQRVEPVEDDLRAVHLPRLVEVDLLRWEGGGSEVQPGHSIGAVAKLLADVDRRVRAQPITTGADWQAGEPTEARGTAGSPPT